MCNDDNQVMEEDGQISDFDLPADMFRSGDEVEETTVLMPHRLPGFKHPQILNVDVKYTGVDDMALFEGDIVLGDLDAIRNAADAKGIGIFGDEFRWLEGIVPYETKEVVRETAEAAIAHWEAHTPIRFKQHEDEEDFISFESRRGCWSRVGRHGGKQLISLGIGCTTGSAIHEIGHALGLWHEQSRSDRDDFVEIIIENVKPKTRHNFDMHIQDGIDLGEYDFNSIMHYPATAFGNGKVTIRTKDGQDIGQRKGLSEGDIAAIRMLYQELDWPEGETETGIETEIGTE
jgi:hypothetical protein